MSFSYTILKNTWPYKNFRQWCTHMVHKQSHFKTNRCLSWPANNCKTYKKTKPRHSSWLRFERAHTNSVFEMHCRTSRINLTNRWELKFKLFAKRFVGFAVIVYQCHGSYRHRSQLFVFVVSVGLNKSKANKSFRHIQC